MEKRDENVIGGQKDRAILQVRKTLERCLDEIPTFPKFHLVLHREDLEDERVHLAVVNGLLGYMYLLQLYVLDYACDHRLPYPRFLKKKGKISSPFFRHGFCSLTWNVEQRLDERARLHFRLVVHAELTGYSWKITDETYHRRIFQLLHLQLIGSLVLRVLFDALFRGNYHGGSNIRKMDR